MAHLLKKGKQLCQFTCILKSIHIIYNFWTDRRTHERTYTEMTLLQLCMSHSPQQQKLSTSTLSIRTKFVSAYQDSGKLKDLPLDLRLAVVDVRSIVLITAQHIKISSRIILFSIEIHFPPSDNCTLVCFKEGHRRFYVQWPLCVVHARDIGLGCHILNL